MSRALVVLDSRFQRQKAADWCWSLKDGTRVEFKAPQRSDDQNSKMWAMLTEVSVQLKWHGLKLTPADWKLQFLDALRRAHGDQVRVVPNTDNSGFVNLGTSSSDLSKEEMSDLIELIFKFGAEHGVKFNDPQSSELPPSDDGSADATTSSAGDPAADLSPADEVGTEEGDNTGQVTREAAPSSDPIPPIKRMLMEECIENMLRDAMSDPVGQAESKVEKLRAVFLEPQNLGDHPDFVNRCADTATRIIGKPAERNRAKEYLTGRIPA